MSLTVPRRVSTGVSGLDLLLGGGVPQGRTCLVQGGPGTGKTTLGLEFLLQGAREGRRALLITLLQSREEFEEILGSHGWSSAGLEVLELPRPVVDSAAAEQTLFRTADVELAEISESIVAAVRERRPEILVLDSITELGLLVDGEYRLRYHLLKLKLALAEIGCTTLMTASENPRDDLTSLQTIFHGAIRLTRDTPEIGTLDRRIEITKMRGCVVQEGVHDARIRTGGLEVFPRYVPGVQGGALPSEVIPSGNAELDQLLGGGMTRGTACLITGGTGAGKSTLATLYARAAAERGQRSLIFCFDERRATFLARSAGLGLEIDRHVASGLIDLRQIDVGAISPGEFLQQVREAVERQGLAVVIIDSITGYFNAMPGYRELMIQLHELLDFLGGAEVLTIMVLTVHGADVTSTVVDASYVADTVILMRQFEAHGAMRRCLSVVKKRYGRHESTIREIHSGPGGVTIGEPLTRFANVLSGHPTYLGSDADLLGRAP